MKQTLYTAILSIFLMGGIVWAKDNAQAPGDPPKQDMKKEKLSAEQKALVKKFKDLLLKTENAADKKKIEILIDQLGENKNEKALRIIKEENKILEERTKKQALEKTLVDNAKTTIEVKVKNTNLKKFKEAIGKGATKIISEKLAGTAAKFIDDYYKAFQASSNDLAQKVKRCGLGCDKWAKQCSRTPKIYHSNCKNMCQARIDLGAGYEMKLRYAFKGTTPVFNISRCVKLGNKKWGIKEKDKKSIAVYGNEARDTLLLFLAEMRAYDQFIVLNGLVKDATGKKWHDNDPTNIVYELTPKAAGKTAAGDLSVERKILKTGKQVRLERVAQAKKSRAHLAKELERLYTSGWFGPQ